MNEESKTTAPICLLLSDGKLFGPFISRATALQWVATENVKGFSTYDLIAPDVDIDDEMEMGDATWVNDSDMGAR